MSDTYHNWPKGKPHPMDGREAMRDECANALVVVARWAQNVARDESAPLNIRQTAERLQMAASDAARLVDDLDLLLMTGGAGATMVSASVTAGVVHDVSVKRIPEG